MQDQILSKYSHRVKSLNVRKIFFINPLKFSLVLQVDLIYSFYSLNKSIFDTLHLHRTTTNQGIEISSSCLLRKV